jgi:hypothetical protein
MEEVLADKERACSLAERKVTTVETEMRELLQVRNVDVNAIVCVWRAAQ